MEKTGFCWRCGKVLKEQKPWLINKDFLDYKDYWCNEKCKNQYEREQEILIKKHNQAKTQNLVLPSGFFYVSKDWYFNKYNNTFYHLKLHLINAENNEYQTNIIAIKPYSYSF